MIVCVLLGSVVVKLADHATGFMSHVFSGNECASSTFLPLKTTMWKILHCWELSVLIRTTIDYSLVTLGLSCEVLSFIGIEETGIVSIVGQEKGS